MKAIGYYAWKKCMEGVRRGIVGPFQQSNIFKDDISYRNYLDGVGIVMQMITHDGGCLESNDCKQSFHVAPFILDMLKEHKIYIPTQEEWDEWDDKIKDDEQWLRGKGVIE